MRIHIRRRNFPYRNNEEDDRIGISGLPRILPCGPARGGGYALLVVMAMAALLLVSLTVALPSIYQEARRERELEVIFRGTQYARAIYRFRRQFQRFPANVKELIQTNGIRFLRQEYPDPMDPNGKWRFIHANAAGVILDSKIQLLPINPTGAPGTSQTPFGSGGGITSPGTSQASQGAGGESPSSGFSLTPTGTGAGGSSPGSQPQLPPAGPNGEILGAFIVGVAPTSHRASIRIWEKHTHYDEWEFLATDLTLLGSPTLPGLIGAFGGPQGQQGGFMGQQGAPGVTMPPSPPAGPGSPPSQTPQ